jgi:hypothetical protein
MLESSNLSLGPWSVAAPPDSGRRVICDATTGQRLGFARWLTPPGAGWQGWFRWPALEVLETDDESLLCTLRRGWPPWPVWEVMDADGRFIGSLRRGVVFDPTGGRFAVLQTQANGTPAKFLDHQGQEVGTLAGTAHGLQLTFAESLQENPFAKMILLAAALVD